MYLGQTRDASLQRGLVGDMDESFNSSPDGIHRPATPVLHKDDEYDPRSFDTLWDMQKKHFWYRGRHYFLLAAVDRFTRANSLSMSAVDLGGGVGGWMSYLADRRPARFNTLALADSSLTALRMAGKIIPARVNRYQINLMNLVWDDQWDVAFLLDVIEHLPNDYGAMCQAARALKSGGYLFVTAPALQQFWSDNDHLVHHQRRYNRKDFTEIAKHAGLELCEARYFMFLLSPLYWFARRRSGVSDMSEEEKRKLVQDTHKVPILPVNLELLAVFRAETPLGHWLHFPWGTSILGVFRKP